MATPSASPPGPDYRIGPAAGRHWLTPFYDLGCEVLGLGRSFRRDVAARLPLGDAGRLLDVGCGTGGLLAEALRRHRGLFATGVDADPAILTIAARRLGRWRGRVALHAGRAESLPLPDGAFDAAVSTLAFHHLPTPAKLAALGEILRVLRPGGRFLLADFGATAGHRGPAVAVGSRVGRVHEGSAGGPTAGIPRGGRVRRGPVRSPPLARRRVPRGREAEGVTAPTGYDSAHRRPVGRGGACLRPYPSAREGGGGSRRSLRLALLVKHAATPDRAGRGEPGSIGPAPTCSPEDER